MARPSVADERRGQILDATLATIAERGISGTTLGHIADTAGMSRGHVRHFAGNRDRLLLDAARHFYADENGSPTILPATAKDLDGTIDYLFGEEFTSPTSDNAIVLAFVELARSSPDIAEVLNAAYSSARSRIATYLAAAKPSAPAATREWAAEGLLAIALGNVFLGDFNADPGHTVRTRSAADALIASL